MSKLELVRQVVLANEERYRQNTKADFDDTYALTYVQESVAGAEATHGQVLPLKDIYNILRINDTLWTKGQMDRTERILAVTSKFGVIAESSKASDETKFQVISEFGLVVEDIKTPEEELAEVSNALRVLGISALTH